MYLYYANLIHFTTSPTFGNMYEAGLYERVLNWVGEAQNVIDGRYYFTVDYVYNETGIAADANINVQKKENGSWRFIGNFSPSSTTTLSSIIFTDKCAQKCVPSDIPSEPLHYYVAGFYVPGFYV